MPVPMYESVWRLGHFAFNATSSDLVTAQVRGCNEGGTAVGYK
jgi:hypothetical protein